jgi:uncharacterized membrane protein
MTPMQIRTAGRLLGFAVLTAALVHMSVVWFLPRSVMGRAFERTGEVHGYNRLVHAPRVDAEMRLILRPEPDMAYSVCAFDLSGGPVDLAAPKTAGFLSVAGYADDTEIFMSVDASQFPDGGFRVTLATEVQGRTLVDPFFVPPGDKGLVVFRRLAAAEADWREVEAEREQMACARR